MNLWVLIEEEERCALLASELAGTQTVQCFGVGAERTK